jgi:2-keto-4-pentenoate hydratase/2-oxohepta-3-ene-1,7-dioic acid hydratase in catechol pathway
MESYGVLVGTEIISPIGLLKALKFPPPLSLDEVITLGKGGIDIIEQLMKYSTNAEKKDATISIEEVAISPPVPSPPKIICLGLNYRDHAKEAKAKIPKEPVIFMKPRTAVIGSEQPIILPSFVKQLDYEAELAMVIGRRGKDISVSDAKDYIFGYTAFNDVSARDIQFKDKQWTRGKSFDTFAPMGPCITTANQIRNLNDLCICTRVNGELRQNSSTKNMVLAVYEVVHYLSLVMTLEPGDVIATGTPAGVGVFMKPEPKFLSSGDVVEIEIEGIGTLRNRIAESGSKQVLS